MFQQAVKPNVDVVRCFAVPFVLEAVMREDFADCRVGCEFFFENVNSFVQPFFGSCKLVLMFLGDSKEF